MSHEIRTPLFGIVGNISLIRDTAVTRAQSDFINNIEGSTKLMMAVIQDIMDFSHIEAGKLRISNNPFSLNRTLALCRGMVEQAAKRKGLDFFMTHLESRVNAIGDCMRILQVLNNLASNAIKFTDRGTVKISLLHTVDEATLSIKIIVSDTGIGFSPDMHACIFSPWVQANDTNRRRYGGSGLGLAISKAILDLMGGTITAQSEVGVGSNFTVNLKLPYLSPDFDLSPYRPKPESITSEMKFDAYPKPSTSSISSWQIIPPSTNPSFVDSLPRWAT
ncbi:hypothetical protein DSO57_1002574 [Entomophthora muscae]|uniref:Uncharacterized protein n=1 Tax=Entomophthora muscae TaxID=34485 RepID=A0ACC2U6H6_9FUNG|nr:hypothetical protein DSO57_1002574 [Entomophthora muscae]